jgi:hypothetical protein
MRTLEEITAEVDYLISIGLYPKLDTNEKRDAEILLIQSNEAKSYLNLTDWYVIRFLETGVVIPSEITTNRALARAKAN